MTTYSKDRMKLVSQGIQGGRVWHYDDTGAIGDVAGVAGFFADAYSMGVRVGDLLFIRASNGSTTGVVHGSAFGTDLTDTGSTQGTAGPQTLVGDTG
jgi:hypothetical protein